ncbi:MAG: glycosyltransferase family 2 protein [Patescibacteria group bacterium]
MQTKSISAFMPAYNEEENILEAVSEIDNYLKKNFADYEILVIDDGSKDKTAQIVEVMGRENNHIKLVPAGVRGQNYGYGTAARTGFRSASKDLVFFTDADQQFDINDLDTLLPLVEQYDMVAGYRKDRKDPLMRNFIAWVYNLLIRLFFGLRVKDVDCAFKVFKRKVFDTIQLSDARETGVINAEILVKALKNDFTMIQVPVKHLPRIKGVTVYESGKRGKIFAWVKLSVITRQFRDILTLWKELRKESKSA